MKRRDLLRELQRIARENERSLEVREGGNHTLVRIGDWKEIIPRHREVKEPLAKAILRSAKNDTH